MNFFEHQQKARSRTGLLVFLFVIAVILIVISVDLAALVITNLAIASNLDPPDSGLVPMILMASTGLTLAVILLGTLYRMAQLSSGGAAVARMAGGRLIDPSTQDPDERKLRNVVEEMAIASGSRVPDIYVIDGEAAINAFAAGFTPADAVIGVTRGCIESLTRDELQGVVAHEFSHIFNGDMRLNLRLIGILNGIMVIGILGLGLVRMMSYSGRRSRSRDSDSRAVIAIFCAGIALTVIGYVGVFFGRLIKASVSREREYLADASAVQFTRNPAGIAGALKKIFLKGSQLNSVQAEQVGHLMFGLGFGSEHNLLSTHPPLVERIRRIDPQFDPASLQDVVRDDLVKSVRSQAVARDDLALGFNAESGQTHAPIYEVPASSALSAETVVASVGTLSPLKLAYATELHHQLPSDLHARAHRAGGARPLVVALLLDDSSETQLAALPPAVADAVRHVMPEVRTLDRRFRLPVIDLALPALKTMSSEEKTEFLRHVAAVVYADAKVTLFEFSVLTILSKQLAPQRIQRATYSSLLPLVPDCERLISALAYAGANDERRVTAAYERGMRELIPPPFHLVPREECDGESLLESLTKLAELIPVRKEKLLRAAAQTVLHDQTVTDQEKELLRAVAEALDCPLPPL
jgi:Zn-dependent protease with chaperone function